MEPTSPDPATMPKLRPNPDHWVFERSSGYAGWRCNACGHWVYEDKPKVCNCKGSLYTIPRNVIVTHND